MSTDHADLPDLDHIARAMWSAQVAHGRAPSCGAYPDWHRQVIEIREPDRDRDPERGSAVGDVWWPRCAPADWLADWHAHPATSVLVVVTNCTMSTPSGPTRARVVMCVDRDGRSVVLASRDDEPSTVGSLRGPLHDAMVEALSPAEDDPLIRELAALTGE